MSTKMVIPIPEKLHCVFGVPTKKKPTVYLQRGGLANAQSWYRSLVKVIGEVVSVPNVSLFVPVTRNAIHKRINEGKLSCFKYELKENDPNVSESLNRERPHAFVPVYECKLWWQEFHDRATAKSGETAPDWMLLDDEMIGYTSIDHNSKPFIGLGQKEYERLVKEYFENRKEKYGW